MTTLAWKFNRLRAMSIAEIAYRGRVWLVQRYEKIRIERGWRPESNVTVNCGVTLFPDIDNWRDEWRRFFESDESGIRAIETGRIDLFAYEGLDIGRPVDWHRDPLTGTRAPMNIGKFLDYRDTSLVGDVKVIWELGRHQHLIPLAVAYATTGNVGCRDEIMRQIDSWIESNPFGRGIHWASALEVALRLISWSVVHSLLILADGGRGLLGEGENPRRLASSIYEQGWFIRHFLSRYSSANNHLIGELAGLFVATQVFDLGVDGQKWNEFARGELEQQARLQVYADGVNKEQAIYYHLWVMEYFLFVWLVGCRSGRPFSGEFRRRVESMSAFLRDLSVVGEGPPQIGDADDGFVTRFEPRWPNAPYADMQGAVAVVFRQVGETARTRFSQKEFWYGLMSGLLPSSVAGSESAQRSAPFLPVSYPEGGYAILGDEGIRIVFDAGSLGYPSIAAHGHADALSFCMAIDNEWWLVDPGTYAYHSDGNWRNYFRGTAAHNTITINETDQSLIGGAFLWSRQAHACLDEIEEAFRKQSVVGSHDGYSSVGVEHRRKLVYETRTRTVEIVDTLIMMSKTASFRAAIHYHFAPDIEIEMDGHSCTATRAGRRVSLRFELPAGWDWTVMCGEEEPIQGWYSPRLGVKVPAPVLTGTRELTTTQEFVTRIEVVG